LYELLVKLIGQATAVSTTPNTAQAVNLLSYKSSFGENPVNASSHIG
jgi:hypothetical protein